MNRENLKRAQEALGQVWDEYKSFRDGLGSDLSKWTPEQKRRIDAFDVDIDKFEKEVDKVERKLNDSDRETRFNSPIGSGSGYGVPLEARSLHTENGWLNGGQNRAKIDDFAEYRSSPNGSSTRHSFNKWLELGDKAISHEEYRGLLASSDIEGGFLVAPPQFVKSLLQDIDNLCFMRKLATQHNLKKGLTLGVPSIESDYEDFEFTTELGTGSQDDGLKFGKREMRPRPFAKQVRISNTLLRVSDLSPEAIVRQRLAIKAAVTEERMYMLGSGANQPLGLFTPSDDGIRADRDVVGTNTTTEIKLDCLYDAMYSLPGPYQARSTWIFSREAIRQMRTVKDLEGRYIWSPALGGQAPSILERPYIISEFVPNTFTAGKFVGVVGDMSQYWICIGLDLFVQRLNELFALTNETGFVGRMELDGAPVVSSAFARIKLAS
jgi:HK97 family phage major capsid protein